MKILRTPDSHFEGLPGWDFEPHYTTITADDGTPIRIAHAEQGPSDGEPIVLMHGNPTWSYLHRHMLRPLASTGRRVIAVDLVGHGRSDKPASKQDYTLPAHIDWMSK
ncbi:MAG: alpha/beta fold hydrolase, partial [Betaproteobacteria bacterium]|nr:alpha/beta fold hydrolase [Betaproteobacteria bacterium]